MVIGNFNVSRVAILPDKANAPLIVYANAVLPGSVATQFFQPVCRRYPQIANTPRIIDHAQLSQGNLLDIGRQFPRPFSNIYFVCLVVFK
jgi:hypothetical protein